MGQRSTFSRIVESQGHGHVYFASGSGFQAFIYYLTAEVMKLYNTHCKPLHKAVGQ